MGTVHRITAPVQRQVFYGVRHVGLTPEMNWDTLRLRDKCLIHKVLRCNHNSSLIGRVDAEILADIRGDIIADYLA